MATNWTAEQRDAIEARGGTLLVSAAAGSGKTAVLSERVIRLLTDPDHPCDADRLLVVTFTKAAAAEMKQRIAEKLNDRLAENPGDRVLQRQRLLLDHAHISTVHSFCSDLLRAHFHRLGLSPTFRIATEDEMLLISGGVLDELCEAVYHRVRTEQNEGLRELIELFSDDRNDRRLGETVRRLYEYVRSHPFPQRWLKRRTEQYRNATDLAETEWGRVLFDYAYDTAEYGIMLLEGALSAAQQDEAVALAYSPALTTDMVAFVRIHEAADAHDWDALVTAVQGHTAERLGAARKADETVKARVKSMRDSAHKLIEGLTAVFDRSEREALHEVRQQYKVIDALSALVTEYGERLDARKREKNVLDFGDLEHGVLKLLVEETEDGCTRTPLALELQNEFDEVMVDEYQDTNGAQELIFAAVSRDEENLFMVGDVKQSIYRFRQASPELFIRRRNLYPLYDRTAPQFPATVLLGKNFRSRGSVTEVCNFLFYQLMSSSLGEVDYTAEEALVPQAVYPPSNAPGATLVLMEQPENEEVNPEAEWIARQIRTMLHEGVEVTERGVQRKAQYRDFCILLRSASGHAEAYLQVLQRYGIPCSGNVQSGFFQQREVSFLLSLLRVIDNPVQDIPLLAVLCAPVYGFTPDELAEIRLSEKHRPLYHALKRAAENGHTRAAAFLAEVAQWRRFAAAGTTRALIEHIWEEKQLNAVMLAMQDGALRLANLRRLAEYAAGYEQAGYRGLSGFIRYIDRLQEQRGDLAPAAVLSESANVVRVMTIHHAKGLEFPFVFMADSARSFNRQSLYGDLLLHPRLGAALKLRDPENGARYRTAAYDAVQAELARDEMSEQMRVLYVALTRARERLFLTCTLKNCETRAAKLAAQLRGEAPVHPFAVRSADSFADWLILGFLRHPDAGALRTLSGVNGLAVLPCTAALEVQTWRAPPPEETADTVQVMPPPDEALLAKLHARFAHREPYRALSRIPVKAAISVLAEEAQERQYAASARPAFLSQSGLTPAERGTALHTFLQFADYTAAAEDPAAELHRLTAQGYLTAEQAAAVEPQRITVLFRSALGQRILQAKTVHREVRFMLPYPATEWDEQAPAGDEAVVLQGVADCVLEEEDGLVLIDFKTDRVQDIQTLVQRYARQLELYARALTQCFEKPVREKQLFSTHLGVSVEVK